MADTQKSATVGSSNESSDERWCFDADEWNGKDVGDNAQFWKPVAVLETYWAKGELLASVRWPDGSRSSGHFVSMMRTVSPSWPSPTGEENE